MPDPYEILRGFHKSKAKFNQWAAKAYVLHAQSFIESQVDNLLFSTFVAEKNTQLAENIFVAEQRVPLDARQCWPGFYSLLDVLEYDVKTLEQLVGRANRLIALSSCQHSFAIITAMEYIDQPAVRYTAIPQNFYTDAIGNELIKGSIESFVNIVNDDEFALEPGELAQLIITSFPEQTEDYVVRPVTHYMQWKQRLEKTLQEYVHKKNTFLIL